MPITPFHFGPGAAIHSAAPRQISFLVFCAANVLIDVEPLYYMMTGQARLHRFFHTYIGATLVAMATVVMFWGAKRLRLSNIFDWRQLSTRAVTIGAFLGAWSHIVIDSVMHADIRPFAPFSDTNPLLEIVSLRALHLFCLVTGAAGLAVVVVRRQAGRT